MFAIDHISRYLQLSNFEHEYIHKYDLKANKGLEAYNQFVCGWVRDVGGKAYGEHCVVKAKVKHMLLYIEQQRLKDKFTKINRLID